MHPDLSPEDWLLLEQYADNTLPEPARLALEERLAAEPPLRQALLEHQQLIAGIRAAARHELRQRLRHLDTEMGPAQLVQEPKAPPMRVVRLWPRVAAAAGLVLGGGLAFMLLRGPGPPQLADRYGAADPGLPVTMGATPSSRSLVVQAMNAYKLGHYDDALAAWNRLTVDQIGADTLSYYRGIFLLKLHRPAEAASELAGVRARKQSALRERADYYYALSLWAGGRVPDARAMFTRLASQRAHTFSDEARKALPHVR